MSMEALINSKARMLDSSKSMTLNPQKNSMTNSIVSQTPELNKIIYNFKKKDHKQKQAIHKKILVEKRFVKVIIAIRQESPNL